MVNKKTCKKCAFFGYDTANGYGSCSYVSITGHTKCSGQGYTEEVFDTCDYFLPKTEAKKMTMYSFNHRPTNTIARKMHMKEHPPKEKNPGGGKKITVIDADGTEHEFRTRRDAANYIGCSDTAIFFAVQKEKHEVKGYAIKW